MYDWVKVILNERKKPEIQIDTDRYWTIMLIRQPKDFKIKWKYFD